MSDANTTSQPDQSREPRDRMSILEDSAMTADAVVPMERARRLARFASGAALAALIAIVVIICVRDIAAPLLTNLRSMMQPGTAGESAVVRVVLSQFTSVLPSLLLIWALTQVRAVLGEYGAGRMFTPRTAAGVRKVGEALVLAVVARTAIVPVLHFYLGAAPELGMRLSTFDLALAAIGVFVMLMGRVLEAAAAIKADSDQIV